MKGSRITTMSRLGRLTGLAGPIGVVTATRLGRLTGLSGLAAAAGLAGLAVLATPSGVAAQGLTYNKDRTVSPAFEGWERNPDGSFSLVFGYMNRNWEEEPDVPIGELNHFSPGQADRGQPTHFLPRRNRFVFKVRVPADFGDKEVVWNLTTQGETLKAYGSLRPDYFIDDVVIMSETGTLGPGSSNPKLRANEPPMVELESGTDVRNVRVGQPLRLVAHIVDDSVPERSDRSLPLTEEGVLDVERAIQRIPSRITVQKILGLYMSWSVYRGPEGGMSPDAVTFNPPQIAVWEDTRPYSNSPWASFWVPPELPEDGRWITEVTFHEPGTYVLRGRADDGGLFTDREVTVKVTPPAS